jgi:hypothetical protein
MHASSRLPHVLASLFSSSIEVKPSLEVAVHVLWCIRMRRTPGRSEIPCELPAGFDSASLAMTLYNQNINTPPGSKLDMEVIPAAAWQTCAWGVLLAGDLHAISEPKVELLHNPRINKRCAFHLTWLLCAKHTLH